MLLHYKYLGLGYTSERHALLATGLGALDRETVWGGQYLTGESGAEAEVRRFRASAVDFASSGHVPWRDHKPDRWWDHLPRLNAAA